MGNNSSIKDPTRVTENFEQLRINSASSDTRKNISMLVKETENLTSITDDSYDVPSVEMPNIFPIEWRIETPILEEIFNIYIKNQWSPYEIPWHELTKAGYDEQERIAMAYWWAKLATFEYSLGPYLAKLMIHGFENHLQDPIKKITGAFVMDEMRHDQCCKLACNALCPGFPWRFKPKNELERNAVRNIKWIYYHASRYWKALSRAFNKYPLTALYIPPIVGECISIHTFGEGIKRAKHVAYTRYFSNITKDETRHYSFLKTSLQYFANNLTDDDRKLLTKQFRDAFILLSIHFYEPVTSKFWKLPQGFIESNRRLEEIAMDTDLKAPTWELRKKLWQATFKRIKDDLEPYGVEVPDVAEVDFWG